MTMRVYLQAARLLQGPPQASDLPAERIFIHASEVPELWVETESRAVPPPGRAVAFAFTHHLDIGFERIVGTVERAVSKRTKRRVETADGAD
ncbi:MAG: hypothetical protein QOG89_3639 [Thermomicrobiales bacterium]|nr:hypothetical protein [Thermomicrobiales bacterium]